MFQATQRPEFRSGDWIQTPWGRCRVVGRLGQRHADLIEAVLFNAERQRLTQDGAIELLVDPARVRKTMSEDRYSLMQIWKLFGEARAAVVEILTPRMELLGGVIDHVQKTRMTRRNPLGGQRHLWTVRLGLPFSELLKRDWPIHYDPASIAAIPHGISQAVARHVLTHKKQPPGGWHLNRLIIAVTGELTSQALRDRRRELKKDIGQLRVAGIVLDGERVRCVEHPPDVVELPPDPVELPPYCGASARAVQDIQDIQGGTGYGPARLDPTEDTRPPLGE